MSLDDIEYRVHAILGPSGAKKWATCSMAPTAERLILEDTTHERTRYGTTGHLVLAECLEYKRDAESYLGRTLLFLTGHVEAWETEIGAAHEGLSVLHRVEVDAEMIAKTLTIINYVNDLINGTGGELYVEQRLSIEHITKERGACGTTDVAVANRRGREVIILDAKYGFVKVYASDSTLINGVEHRKPNLQLAMYADAWLNEYDPLGMEFDTVRLIIAQPFVNPPFNEAVFTRAELQTTIDWLAERAEKTRTAPEYSPSFEACMWCKAKATCTARDRVVLSMAAEGFADTDELIFPATDVLLEQCDACDGYGEVGGLRQDGYDAETCDVCNGSGKASQPSKPLPSLGQIHEMIPMIRDWCDSKEALIKEALRVGLPVVGDKGEYKLAQGARGDRKWVDADVAASELEFLLPNELIYSQKINGPAKIEALTIGKKAVLDKSLWNGLQGSLVTRGEQGPPKIVLSTDPAPAIGLPTDGFTDTTDDLSDLF